MPGSADRLREIMSRFLDDPGSSHPYVLTADRVNEYKANEDEWLDPNVEIEIAPNTGLIMPGMSGRSRGRDTWWYGWLAWLEVWGEYRFSLRNWEELGDEVVVDIEVVASGQLSGAPASISVAQLWTIRDSRIASLRVYASRAEALEAVGGRAR